MGELTFYINIEDASGNRLGSGPITSAAQWQYTARMDKAGEFAFSLPATDTQAGIVQRKRIARAYALMDGAWVEVGAGIIDSIIRRPQADGTILLEISGSDLLRELTYRSVRNLRIYLNNEPISHAAAVAAVAAYAPAGWTVTPDATPPVDSIYGRFNGESVLAGLIKIAEKSQSHFYRGSGRSIVFASDFADSGVRAISAGPGDLAPATCAITALSETVDTYDLLTRIYPRGSGNGDVQLTLRPTTRTAPSGYTLDKSANYLENDAATVQYGRIEEFVEWREIGPIDNTALDLQSAANMLFDEALRELERRSELVETPYYDLALAGCSALLRPMQTVRVVYRDVAAGIEIDRDLNIIEATWSIDANGVQTTALTVTTADRWPQSDARAVADELTQGRVYQAHPQLNANSYTTGYTANVDQAYNASFRFRLGSEVVQVQQVLMEFQLLPFESTMRAVGGATSGSGSIPTGGPSTNDTGSGGNNETGTGGGGDTSSATPALGSATPALGSATPAIGGSTPAIGGTALTTGSPSGGDTISAGRHGHQIYVKRGTFDSGTWLNVYFNNSDYRFYVIGSSGEYTGSLANMTNSGDHTHAVSSHTHTIAAHTHTIAAHTHTIAAHTHTIAAHTHTIAAHTHSMANHTHSLNNHTHDLSESITAIYGIFREQTAKTYAIADLQYRVNNGSWADLASAAVDAGSGWWQLDVTDAIINADTFRPVQVANTIEMRAAQTAVSAYVYYGVLLIQAAGIGNKYLVYDVLKLTGTTNYDGEHVVTGTPDANTVVTSTTSADYGTQTGVIVLAAKTVTIDALLSVRNIIQAVAYV